MRTTVICMILAVFALVAMTASGQPAITIYTDADAYQSGDTIEVSLSAENSGEATSVDVYLALFVPDDSLLFIDASGGLTGSIEPWLVAVYIPVSFEMGRTPVLRFGVPDGVEGGFQFAAGLTAPGTLNFKSEISYAPFAIRGGPGPGIRMLPIPAGSFLMGSPEDEEGRGADEDPQHTVSISALMIAETEVTQKQWEDVMGWNESGSPGDDYPVSDVSWLDCLSFCNRLSEAGGLANCYTITDPSYDGDHVISAEVSCNWEANGYRLPTEAEWEYACRAGTTTRFYTGDSESDLGLAAWFSANSGHEIHPVGEREPNAWGLYDMHGNLSELCWDWYDPDYYEVSASADPKGPPSGPWAQNNGRVCRSGVYYAEARNCRSASRDFAHPGDWSYCTGFRIARSQGSTGPSTDIIMVSIPAGPFLMGSPDDEEDREPDEGPQRTVNISAFQMSKSEVTEKLWEDVMGWNDCFEERGDNYPIEGVTWYDCVSFCNELSEANGYVECYTIMNISYSGDHIAWADVACNFDANGYRLPTEAEWEYACRAGTTTRFYGGDSESALSLMGWHGRNSGLQKREVRQKRANGFGIYDMHGNANEWCWDWYSSGYYGLRPDPDDDPRGPASGTCRVARGGSWCYRASSCRSAVRFDWCTPDKPWAYNGVRLVRSE